MINLFEPSIGDKEFQAVNAVLESHWLGKGEKVREFETAWAKHIGVPRENVVSTNSCTSALFEAVRLAGIGKGDEVIIPTIHFVGAAQAVYAVGGVPVFCDVDKWTMNAANDTIDAEINKKTKAIILNHYGGMSPDIDRAYLKRWKIKIIDDLACAPATKIDTFYTDFAVWSFDSMKVLTMGDGGILYSQNPILATQARQDFCLGVNSESGMSSKKDNQWWTFEVERLGQGRQMLNDIAASIGLCQLEKLDGFISDRVSISAKYADHLSGIPGLDARHGWYSFHWIFTERRDELAGFLREAGIYVSMKYWPLHLAFKTGDNLPRAEWAARHVLNLPLHANLSDENVQFIVSKIKEFFA